MTWRVLATAWSQPDLDRLSRPDHAALIDDLFDWVAHGPPCRNRRLVAGVEVFEDDVPSGCVVTYFVNKTERYVGVLRVGRR